MFSKIFAATAACAALASAQTYNLVQNLTPTDIAYAFVGENDSIMSTGTIPANGGSQQFALGNSFNVKMCYDCTPSAAESGILQFEYSLTQASGGLSYDWSDINGPSPFSSVPYTLTPWSSGCPTESCGAGDGSNDCQYTTSGDYNPHFCGLPGSGVVITATIGS